MATISNKQIAQTIFLTLKEKRGNDFSNSVMNVVNFLHRRRLLSKSNLILSELQKIINQDKGMISAKLTSAGKIKEGHHREIVHLLKERYSANEVELEEAEDKSLIGGFKIEANDEVIDLTVKNKIEKLKEHLTR